MDKLFDNLKVPNQTNHPLFAVTQVTRKVPSNQCWTRRTLTSEYLDCHILLWNKLGTLVFVNWSRRSRTTLTDILFNEIYDKTKPTIRSVQNQRTWFRTWATWSCLNCSRQTLGRSAKNAYLSYWSESILYCTCGHLLKESVPNRGVIEYTLDLLSIPEYVIKKGRPHGHRYGKTHENKEYHQAHNLKKRCIKKSSQRSTIVSCEILIFVNPCSNMIEMKTFRLEPSVVYIKPLEPFCAFSTLVWRQMEEYKGRRRKQQQISVLYWFFRRNSLPSSSPRSIRTQSYGFLHYKTMSWFRATSSNTLIMSEVQSVFFPSSIRDWYLNLDTIDGEPVEFEWNVFPGFTTLQLCYSVQEFLSKTSEEPEEFTRRIIFMSMFNDISWESEDNTKECELSAQLVSQNARRFGAGQWSFLGLGSEKNGTLPVKTVHKEKGTELQSKCCWHLENAHTQSSDPRVHCPEECLNAKVVENCQYIVAPIWKRLKLFFAQLFDHLHVDVQRHLRGILRQWTGMRIKRQTHFDLCEKIFTKKMVIPRTWIRKELVFLVIKANHEENGTESQSWWWWNSVKADTQSSDPRVHCSKECSEAAQVAENYQYTSALMRERLKLFFAQSW